MTEGVDPYRLGRLSVAVPVDLHVPDLVVLPREPVQLQRHAPVPGLHVRFTNHRCRAAASEACRSRWSVRPPVTPGVPQAVRSPARGRPLFSRRFALARRRSNGYTRTCRPSDPAAVKGARQPGEGRGPVALVGWAASARSLWPAPLRHRPIREPRRRAAASSIPCRTRPSARRSDRRR